MDFIDDFISEYKNNPCLWKADSTYFKNRTKRQEAYLKLIDVAAKHGEHYNIERTKQKINNLRCAFRHQLKKYIEMKSKGEKEDLFCPKRRYFESLMFLKDEENTEKTSKDDNRSRKSWKNSDVTEKQFNLETEHTNDKSQIINIIHRRNVDNSAVHSNPLENVKPNSFVSFESLNEDKYSASLDSKDVSSKSILDVQIECMKEPINNKKTDVRKRSSSVSSQTSNDADFLINSKTYKVESAPIDIEKLFSIACKSMQGKDDNFSNFGKIVAHRLRSMEATQSILAEKIIGDVLFQGQMQYLSPSSTNYFSKVQSQIISGNE